MTKTELRRRIRELTQRARRQLGYSQNCRTEIGLRAATFVSVNPPESSRAAYAENDDLDQYVPISYWLKHFAQAGEVVHIYISSRDDAWGRSGELLDVVMGWVGTDEYEPMLLLRSDQR